MATFESVLQVKRKLASKLLKRKGIYGVGVGFKNPANPKQGAALIIYANQAAAVRLGTRGSKFSAVSKGKTLTVPVRIVRCGKCKANANYRRRIRPVQPGYSVGTTDGSGSAGLIVRGASSSSRRLYLLSNNHVLNPDNTGGRIATIQPGGSDGGSSKRDRIGRLYCYVRLNPDGDNMIDAAITIPARRNLLNPKYPTVGAIPGHVTSYRVGDRLKKVGRTTGLRYGTVESVNTDLTINYGGRLGDLKFVDQTVISGSRPVSLPGDSGSVWLRRSDNAAAAVNFAGSDDGRMSIAFPIHWAMQAFGVRVARPGNRAGAVKRAVRGRSSGSRTRQLTAKELMRFKPRTVRGQ